MPTPTRPEIAEADDALFERLRVADSQAADTNRYGRDNGWRFGVTVLEQKRVAGMDVAVLKANNAAALNRWLKENGFPSRAALQQWLVPYVRAGFKIAAFKYAKSETNASKIATQAVRISFNAPSPFYPYRMPTDTEVDSSQILHVFMLASKKTHGYLTEDTGKRDWGQIIHTQPVNEVAKLLAGALPADKLPTGPLWLTV